MNVFLPRRALLSQACRMLLSAALVTGCSSDNAVFEQYRKAAVEAEADGSGTNAEAYYVSALHRARTSLGKVEQSDALYQLGVFYRRGARFQEAAKALTESLDLAADARITDPMAISRRRVELARSLAALNRWAEGTATLRPVIDHVSVFPAGEQVEIRELLAVYRTRLKALGADASVLQEP
jgi:hypothetical protein